MERGPVNIVLFAEDPGAVNSIAPLAVELVKRGEGVMLLSSGHATLLLQARGLDARPVSDPGAAAALLLRSGASRLLVGTSENPDSPGLALIAAARDAQMESIGIIDFAANAAFRFRGNTAEPLAFAPDWLLVPDAWTAKEYEAIGYPANRIHVSGHPHYDHVMQIRESLEMEGRDAVRRRVLPGIPNGRAVVAFVSEISTGLDPQQYRRSSDYTLHGRGKADGRTEIVVEELLDAITAIFPEISRRPWLVLRRHPKELETGLADLVHQFDSVSQNGDPLELAYVSDLVVGMSSMLLLEANLLGVETLSLLPREKERNWLPTVRQGITPCAINRDQLRRQLSRLLCEQPGTGTQTGKKRRDAPVIPLGATTEIVNFLSTTDDRSTKSSASSVPSLETR